MPKTLAPHFVSSLLSCWSLSSSLLGVHVVLELRRKAQVIQVAFQSDTGHPILPVSSERRSDIP